MRAVVDCKTDGDDNVDNNDSVEGQVPVVDGAHEEDID